MTDAELLGSVSAGKCQDCGWNNNSAVAKACGCMHLIHRDEYDQDEHLRLMFAARKRKAELRQLLKQVRHAIHYNTGWPKR